MAPLEYLDSLRRAHPELSDWCDTLAHLYQTKLWHQLTLNLQQFIQLSLLKSGDRHALTDLYHNFITHLETNINPLTLAHFAVMVSKYCLKEQAITYLEGVIQRLQATNVTRIQEPILYINIQIAFILLINGDENQCKNLLEDGKRTLDSITDIDPSVYSKYYWVSLRYHQHLEELSEYYKSALLFLAHTSLESLSHIDKMELGHRLTLSALVGDNIYDFGELLEHPIIKSLRGTQLEWLYYYLETFNSGDKLQYLKANLVYSHTLFNDNTIWFNRGELDEKFHIICLMEVISSRAPEDRTIPLSIIMKRTRLRVEHVEWLLMKCLSLHLIEGVIDQVDGVVCVSWVRPRVSGISQAKSLRDRLDKWIAKVHTASESVEAAAV